MSAIRAIGKRRRSRHRAAGHSSHRNRPRSPVTIDLEIQTASVSEMSASSCIDLTCDDDDIVTVDLTSVNDASVVCLGSQTTPRRSNRRSQRNVVLSSAVESESEIISEDELEELPLPAFFNPPIIESNPEENIAQVSKVISCPICLDDEKQLQHNQRHFMSTICGHVFCNACLTAAVQSQHKCPSCRRKLSVRQIHPIFI